MNIFEDLVVELKEENLLESTIIEMEAADAAEPAVSVEPVVELQDDPDQNLEVQGSSEAPDAVMAVETTDTAVDDKEAAAARERESYKKRAVSEVSGLQMVEHVLTGVEREYMKIVPKTFDDLNAKKALHAFLNAEDPDDAEAHSARQFTLVEETEAWCTALCERDRDIPVASLRLYCENSKPALSSQALVGLARFYRNLPYSETVRSKFDFTITRLFSRPVGGEKRVCLFTRDEMLNHITTLYGEWSSVPLYTADEDESNVLLTALSFEDLSIEAEQASTFDQLITSDFFSRLRLFKESIAELFFAPNVTAAAIECNIRIGNAYVDLIHRERAKMDEESIESKYGDLNEQAVSDAAARTLKLVELLRSRVIPDVEETQDETETAPAPQTVQEKTVASEAKAVAPEVDENSFGSKIAANFRTVNKWFLALSILIILASVSVWVWANYVVVETVPKEGVENLIVDNSFLAEHIKTAKISGGTLYGVLLPSWDALPEEKREEFAQKVQKAGAEKGYTQVTLITKDGKMSAFASSTRVDIIMP